MGTALIYLVAVLGVAALFFVGASAVFGRGEELAPIPPGATPTWLPERDVRADDVRSVRFQQAVRGYKMAEVDWVLERLAGELDRTAGERDELRRRVAALESAADGAAGGAADGTARGAADGTAPGAGSPRTPASAPTPAPTTSGEPPANGAAE